MDLVIANTIDAYRDNVALIVDPALRQAEIVDSYYLADRALLWAGRHKLVLTSLPVESAHLRYLQGAVGYPYLENLWPRQASDSLCADILREDGLRRAVAARLRGAGEVRLISFVASAQVLAVAEALRQEGLTVTTPECPPADLLWVRDYMDSKAGFRRFLASIEPALCGLGLPEGGVARNTEEAARLAARYLAEGRACLCKPNNSQSGVGFLFLRPGELAGGANEWPKAIQARLDGDTQMTSDCIIVEELIEADRRLGGGSPSIEMRIPADPERDVEFMYLCGQMLTADGYFIGVEMHDGLLAPELQQALEEAGVAIAREMRRLGYVGVFDIDLVAGTDGRMYAVEVNTRRTGGTHAHEVAEALFGRRYWQRAAVISNNNLGFDGPQLSYAGLQELLEGLLFPIDSRQEGILPTIVSGLVDNRLGYIAFGATVERARELEAAMRGRLAAAERHPRAH